jgi:hypothetical protein
VVWPESGSGESGESVEGRWGVSVAASSSRRGFESGRSGWEGSGSGSWEVDGRAKWGVKSRRGVSCVS